MGRVDGDVYEEVYSRDSISLNGSWVSPSGRFCLRSIF